ncbi:hypothetical protein CERZMDRAFT_100881 [Cercospora zeae-maydis SCOH1-5]|uniref:F-box domain-containing protein n=1 Tax=Cercospora zeae-maydis SCOH1-5 TaxID=717836 RepID=A0A6A6F8B2_9PEZI|nr:hypothetical protein CERZMDRAFT_100881 [Cercospora zeae-maydis SCOH1-5]
MFSQLPDELNDQILAYFEPDDKATLGSVCLTNKRGHRLATPLFYSHVDVVGDRFDDQSDRDIIRLGRLCQTLVEDPPRCAHVKTIRLSRTCTDRDFRLSNYLHFDIQQCEQILTGLPESLRHSISKYLHSAKRNEEPLPRSTLAGLLLAMCPQARALQVEGELHMNSDSLLRTVLIQMSTQPPSLAFRDVQLNSVGEHTISLADLVPILHLPSMSKLTVSNFKLHPGAIAPGLTSRLRSLLQHLTLMYCAFDILDFAPLLICCPNLRSLSIEWYHREDNFWRMDWPTLGGALRRLTSLESLRIEHRHDPLMTVNYREANGLVPPNLEVNHMLPMGSIRSLERLREAIVPSLALFGGAGFHSSNETKDDDNNVSQGVLSSLLPASLRRLTVLHEDIYLAGDIRLLHRDSMVSRLDKFVLYNCQKDRWMDQDGVEGFTQPAIPDLVDTAPQYMMGNTRLLVESIQESLGLIPPTMRSTVMDHWHREAGEELPLGECMIVRAALQEVRAIFGI